MAANHVNRKRKFDSSYRNCPKPMLNVVPANCTKVNFSDLIPGENYEYKAIIGKIQHLYPIGQRMAGYVRKILVTDALTDCDDLPKLTIFLLDQFARDSGSAEIEGFIVVTNFTVEKLTHNKNDMQVQILVQKQEAHVWFGRKKVKEKRKSKSPNPHKRQRTSDDEESHAVVTHHYEYTKLRDLVETGVKDSYNVYGIVDKCDLRITQAKKMQILDLSLTDQTETGFSCIVFAGGGETVPDVYPGDIVRIHRMQVNKFRGRLRGRCPTPKFILVFSKNNEGDKPRTVAKTFTFTPEDITRFRELFEWNKSKNDPKLISEIRKGDFANIICQVIGVYIARTTDAVILKLWDGTKTDIFPGVHWAMKEERLDQSLFTVARNYYIVLSVYGHHTAVAGELEPGQYIEVRDAHLHSPKDNPDDCKLSLHAGNKEGRGISVLQSTDNRLVTLKERLDKVIADTLEFGNQTTDHILSQNNSIFLNCDISVFNSQPSQRREENSVDEAVPPEEGPPVSNENDVEMLNEPLLRNDAPIQNQVVTVVDVSIKPGQSTQEFGLGMPRDNTLPDNENRPSVASEPDPTSNMTPFQTRNYIHDPLQLSSQMTSSIFPSYSSATDEEWWNSMPSAFASVTDGHSDVKPTSLAEAVRHSVPNKFRILTVVLCFKPEATSIQKFIHLFCPKCSYLSEDATPSIEPFEMREGLPYYFCPECSKEEANNEQCSVLEYTFLISFSLHDGSGVQSIEAYIWKENAVKFFKGITPEEALRDSATADSILHMLWNICPNCRPFNSTHETSSVYPVLDCCILSYSIDNSTHYQLFDTVLI